MHSCYVYLDRRVDPQCRTLAAGSRTKLLDSGSPHDWSHLRIFADRGGIRPIRRSCEVLQSVARDQKRTDRLPLLDCSMWCVFCPAVGESCSCWTEHGLLRAVKRGVRARARRSCVCRVARSSLPLRASPVQVVSLFAIFSFSFLPSDLVHSMRSTMRHAESISSGARSQRGLASSNPSIKTSIKRP